MSDISYQFKTIRNLTEDHGGWILGALAPKDADSKAPLIAAVRDGLSGETYSYADYHADGHPAGSPAAEGNTLPTRPRLVNAKTNKVLNENHLPPSVFEALKRAYFELSGGWKSVSAPDYIEERIQANRMMDELEPISTQERDQWGWRVEYELESEAAKLARAAFEQRAGEFQEVGDARGIRLALQVAGHYADKLANPSSAEKQSWAEAEERRNEKRAAGQSK